MFRSVLPPFLHLSFLMTRPLTVGVRAICYDPDISSIVLIKHTYAEGWELPGGGVEVGESMICALKRELSEETGIECKSARLLDVYYNSSVSKRDHVVIYLVECWTQTDQHERPALEIAEINWFRLDDLPKDVTPCTQYALKRYLREDADAKH